VGRTCVLVVDTDGIAVDVLRAADDDYDLRTVETVADAQAAVESEPVDCVVTEYALPDGDGIDLLRTVRTQWPDLPFLLFTADGDEGVASDAIGAGVTDYLPKSRAAALARRVRVAVADHHEQRAVLGRMTDAFFAVDTSWEFTYVNEQGRSVLCDAIGEELSAPELLGRSIWAEIPSAADTQFYEAYHRAMDEQRPVSFESYFEPLETWFEVRAYPSPTGLSVYFRDVTDRRAREEALAERERTLREAYQIVSDKERTFEEKVDALFHLGRDVLETNCAALSTIDGDDYVFELVHDPAGEVTQGDVVPLQATNCEQAVLDEETLVLSDVAEDAPELSERAGFTEMGISRYLGTPVWVDGEVDGTFCFFDRDTQPDPFTDWEVTLVELLGKWVSYELERERRAEELTRERNRLKDFASLVSHDLRNPLTVALGRLDIVREHYDGDPGHVDALETALNRMDALIEDLLVLSRSGNQTVAPEPHGLRTVVEAAWEATGTDAATVHVHDGDASVYGDPVSFQQLLENLLRNAVEHGGEAVTVEVGLVSTGDGFYVADDGPGIPDEERDRVFESGYTTSDDGTGFGLRIVKEILDAHGWDVAVTESERGGVRIEITGCKVD
jgi:signal transduction histidine kinase